MGRKKLLLVVFFVLVFTLFAIGFLMPIKTNDQLFKDNQSTIAEVELQICYEEKENEPADPHCYALLYEDLSYCDDKAVYDAVDGKDVNLSVKYCKYGSIITIAMRDDDVSMCDDIDDEHYKNICIALVSKDVSTCEYFDSEVDYCKQILQGQLPSIGGDIFDLGVYYLFMAVETKDDSYCEKIGNYGDSMICKAFLTKDKKYCDDPQFVECDDSVYVEGL